MHTGKAQCRLRDTASKQLTLSAGDTQHAHPDNAKAGPCRIARQAVRAEQTPVRRRSTLFVSASLTYRFE